MSLPCAAQDAPVVRQGTTELGAFVGASYGADDFRVMGGGNVSYAVTKVLMPYGEFSYFPGLPRQAAFSAIPGGKANFDLPLADVHGGVHIRVPIREKRFVPYGVFGMGLVHNYSTSYTVNYTVNGVPQSNTFNIASANSFALNFGGGVRYYINQKYGVRVEAKAYRAFNGPIDAFFSKYEFGFFYQIR